MVKQIDYNLQYILYVAGVTVHPNYSIPLI